MDRLEATHRTVTRPVATYRLDPVGYARDVLKVQPTPDQERIARAVIEPPHRVMVESGHNVGKTFLAAWLSNWWYDTRDPGITITTAPTLRDVVDLLWTEVRLQRQRAGLASNMAPSAPEMRTGPEHYAKGYTARRGESFQGRHRQNMLFVFDEAEGVDATYWKTVDTMFQPDGTNAFLAILNPTTTTSQSYLESQAVDSQGNPKWKRFTISALDHPNVRAGLLNRGRATSPVPIPVPSAVTLEQVEGWLADWFEPVAEGEHDPLTDIEFPPGSGQWLRPDPDGEARVLGRRPTAGAFGVWSERLWDMAANPVKPLTWSPSDVPAVGCDVARFGTDKTEMHSRCGPCSIGHEDHGGWDTTKTTARLMEMADTLAKWANRSRDRAAEPVKPQQVRLVIDDTGVGGGVTDQLSAHGYNVMPVNAGEAADHRDRYPRVRDELWFVTRDMAKAGKLDLSRLPAKRLAVLKQQALIPTWRPTPDRRRSVESKEDTVKRLGRSPDGMDAVNLAYYEPSGWGMPRIIETA